MKKYFWLILATLTLTACNTKKEKEAEKAMVARENDVDGQMSLEDFPEVMP